MIVRGHEIGQRVKYWVRPDIINRIEEGSIKAFYNANVEEIKKNELLIKTAKGREIIDNDFVLALTGYEPDFNFLKTIGVNLSNDEKMLPQYDPDTMETNIPGLYLAGVICGGMETHKWFIENSRIHAKIIVKSIQSKIIHA